MDPRFAPSTRDQKRAIVFELHAITASPAAIAAGATPQLDLSPFVSRAQQTDSELSLTVNWHRELNGAAQPRPGQAIAAKLDGVILAIAIIESLNDYRLASGTRTLSITCRSRDATPAWREVPRITQDYPQGTRLDVIARDVALDLGLAPEEILLPPVGVHTPHSSVQLAQIPAWQMLETLLCPGGFQPFVDGLGRLRAYSRDVTRDADVTLTEDRIESITGSRSRPAITRLQLKWLDPLLTKVSQQDQVLGQANITAGFFQMKQEQEVYFSEDRRQRATSSHLVIKQSANSGLLPVCSEKYGALAPDGADAEVGGRITLETHAWVPALIATFAAVKLAGALPDGVDFAVTIPYGKIVHAGLEFGVLLTMAAMGTGSYEVWGTPYDYVHGRNTTEAYDPVAPTWADKAETLESDFIANDSHAQSVAGREFLYRALSTSSYGVNIVDDPRIERGDVLALPDGSGLFVTGYSRDLTHGAPAMLNVQGFPV